MPVLVFLFEAVLISLSGVMAPGPMTAVIVGKGTKSPHSGAQIAIGHGIIEFPLMIAIFYGFGYIINLSYIKEIIGIVGGLFLLIMCIGMFSSINKGEVRTDKYPHSPMLAGILISIGNPYFIIWWATVGAALILRSAKFGILWFLIFALLHWLCDFLWCSFLSNLSFRGRQFFGRKFQKYVFAICGVFLLFFSGKFIFNAVRLLIR